MGKRLPCLSRTRPGAADGGLPQGRTTLIPGTAGAAKMVLAARFLVEGVRIAREAGVFVTFEESPADIRAICARLVGTSPHGR
jgi:KaiC/GvpD/RAD55 family RecA-like ATPase